LEDSPAEAGVRGLSEVPAGSGVHAGDRNALCAVGEVLREGAAAPVPI